MSALPIEPTPPPSLQITQFPPEPSGPLNSEQMNAIYGSARLARPIRKAERFAAGNGWLTLIAGCITVPFAISDPPTLIFGVLLGAIGTHELTLRRRLHRFEPKITNKLALNQIFLAGLLIIYGVVKMVQSAGSEGMISSAIADDPTIQSSPEIAEMLSGLTQLEQIATVGLYALIIIIAIIMQGSSALYYLIKGKALRKFRARTPEWVIGLHHAVDGHR
jgi:uncharacterized membrane protein